MTSPISLSRRRFVHGLVVGSASLKFFGLSLSGASLANPITQQSLANHTLRGKNFNLSYTPTKVNFTGNERYATAINGSVPAPTLYWKEGDMVTLKVSNHLAEDASIHWHGILLESSQDGVPNISDGFTGIKPGESFTYQFPVRQNGTYWYHSHSGFHEQTGAYGAIIIEPYHPYPYNFDCQHTILLSDWSDTDPDTIYANLKKLPHYYNQNQRTMADLWREISTTGLPETFQERAMWGHMRMSDRDISDVTGSVYTYLMNGITPATGWKGLFRNGEKILLRFINGSAMTFFDVRIPDLKMQIVAADGQYIEPISVDEFRIGTAETYDVIVTPHTDTPYTIFAQAIDRSGYALGTLTPDLALTAKVPLMDPKPVLTHADMGMHHTKNGEHSGHAQHHATRTAADHGHHHTNNNTNTSLGTSLGKAGMGSTRPIYYADIKDGPQTAMRTDNPQSRLTDPGVGLRNNGRRVLSYADLRSLYLTADPREPGRELDLHLTGNMNRYMWSFNGIKFADSAPLHFHYGERLRINLINNTMMNHPIHLHGMWSDLETGDPTHIPHKHTVIIQPGTKIGYLITADAKGDWAYHCHLLYHMLGMFRIVTVS